MKKTKKLVMSWLLAFCCVITLVAPAVLLQCSVTEASPAPADSHPPLFALPSEYTKRASVSSMISKSSAAAFTTEPEAKLFESKTLAAGNHTAHITVLEKRNEASTGTGSVYGVQFVYAKAFEAEIAEPEFPGYTEVDDAVFTTNHEPFKIQYEPARQSLPQMLLHTQTVRHKRFLSL